jgi:hypothetical protein
LKDVAWIYIQLHVLFAVLSLQLGLKPSPNLPLGSAIAIFLYHYAYVYCEALGYICVTRKNPRRKETIAEWVWCGSLKEKYPKLERSLAVQDYISSPVAYLRLHWSRSRRYYQSSKDSSKDAKY